MRWWRREHQVRTELQVCQSRLRVARAALEALRTGFLEMAMELPILEVAPMIARLDELDQILGGDEEGGAA
jgi:hypothetical protein